MPKSTRQTFKQGQKVVICTSRGGTYGLPNWVQAEVTNPEPKICPNKVSYHYCHSSCKPVPDPRYVDIVRLDRDGKMLTDSWSKKTVRNMRNVIMDRDEAQPMLEEIARRAAKRVHNNTKRQAISTARQRIDRAAVPMAKALKKIQLTLSRESVAMDEIDVAASIAADALALLKVPKKEKED